MSHLIDTPAERKKLVSIILSFFLALMVYEVVAIYYVGLNLQEQILSIVVIAIVLLMVLRKKRR